MALGLATAAAFSCIACGSTKQADTQSADSGLYVGTAMQSGVSKDAMQKIFEIMTKEGSGYSELKSMDTYTEYSEKLDGNTITVTAKGEYVNGSWDYVLEGDYVVNTTPSDEYMGISIFSYLSDAVGEYLGMDTDLLNGFLKAISLAGVESNYVQMAYDETTDTFTSKIYVAGPFDFSVLDSVYINEEALYIVEPLDENSHNYVTGAGKVNMYAYGSKDSLDIYFAEHGGRTDLTYKSLLESVKALQPEGYEDFVKDYTALAEVETDDYQVSFVEDREEIPEYFMELDEHQKFTKVHFGEKYEEE